jgi:hypothetical protein
MSSLHAVAPDIIKTAEKSGSVTVANLKIPTGGLQQKIPQQLGRIMQKAPNVSGGLQFLTGGKGLPMKMATQLAVKGVVGKKENVAQPLPSYLQDSTYDTQSTDTAQAAKPVAKFDENAFMQQARSYGLTPPQAFSEMQTAKNKFDTLQASASASTTGKVLPKDKANAQQGLKKISEIEGMLTKRGGVMGLETAVPYLFQSGDTKQLTTANSEIMDIITRLRTGAALNQQEQEYYATKLPNIWDDAETVQYKLNMFKDLFTALATGSNISSTSTTQ